MALEIYTMKNVAREAYICVIGSGSATLKLKDLCFHAGDTSYKLDGEQFQEEPLRGDFSVGFLSAQATGDDMKELRVKRNGVTIMTLVANPVLQLKFDGEFNPLYRLFENSDIEFETDSGDGQIEAWFELRKKNYRPFDEEANFGIHDDTTKAGE